MSRYRSGSVCTDIEHLTDYVMQEHVPETTQSAGVTWNARRVVRRKPSMTVTGRGPVAASDQLAHHRRRQTASLFAVGPRLLSPATGLSHPRRRGCSPLVGDQV